MTEIQPAIEKDSSIDLLAPALARDLAQDLYSPREIIERHNLSQTDVQRLFNSSTFRAMVVAAKMEWANPGNAKTRARLKAQLAIEESIPELFALITDIKEAGPARVSAFSQLKDVGQFEKTPPDQVGAGGPGFSVTINLGAEAITVSAPPQKYVAEEIEGEVADE